MKYIVSLTSRLRPQGLIFEGESLTLSNDYIELLDSSSNTILKLKISPNYKVSSETHYLNYQQITDKNPSETIYNIIID